MEVNAHSLFSRWFSESGKLVGKLFSKIHELVEDEDALVFVLVDEVESLSAARKASGTEPSDAIRVVNALLTQLDSLRARPNVLIMTTSNLPDSVDIAFVDRADVKIFVGLPTLPARYQILRSCLVELHAKGIIMHAEQLPPPWPQGGMVTATPGPAASKLLAVVHATDGLSGRALRKLPFLAHAQASSAADVDCGGQAAMHLDEFLDALLAVTQQEQADRAALNRK